MIKHFTKNTVGNDYVVGDIHGCFTKLQNSLDRIGFNPAVDRLFSVGDLVDRGPESNMVLEWLAKPWLFPVRGNHEDFAIRHVKNGPLDFDRYARNGGAWFMALSKDEQISIAEALDTLPYSISIETDIGKIGVVHADTPFDTWGELEATLNSNLSKTQLRRLTDWLLWSRERASSGYDGTIEGIAFLIVGHTSVASPLYLGNVIYIDTMGWNCGEFTLIQIQRANPKIRKCFNG